MPATASTPNPVVTPGGNIDLPALAMAWEYSRESLKRPREERVAAVRQYVGHHYAEDGAEEPVLVNLLYQYVSIVGRQLVPKAPRVMLSTRDRRHGPLVDGLEQWLNEEIERSNFADELQRCVIDALFSVGVMYVDLASPAWAAQLGWGLRAGEPFARRVDLDDWAFDAHARDFAEAGWMAHRFRVPLDSVRDSPLYTKERKKLVASDDPYHNPGGDERVGVIARGRRGAGLESEYEPHVDLWQFYLPGRRLVVTLSDDQLTGMDKDAEPLRAQEWLGPDGGPYHVLGMGTVPGCAMPVAPVMQLIDMHELENNLQRKLAHQAERQKDNLLVEGPAHESAERVRDAPDGEIVKITCRPDQMKQVSWNGPNPLNQAFFEQNRVLFSWLAGNLDALGGLAPQAKTAKQDSMLNENASRQVADMQERTVAFTAAVLKSMAWFHYHHPTRTMRTTKAIPGVPELTRERLIYPNNPRVAPPPPADPIVRSAPWKSLRIEVDPYSMQYATPASKMSLLNSVVTQMVMPMMQLLREQGIVVDANVLLGLVAKWGDLPELKDVLSVAEPPADPAAAPGGGDPGMPQSTTRNYVRESRSQTTGLGQSRSAVQALLGQNPGGNPDAPEPAGA